MRCQVFNAHERQIYDGEIDSPPPAMLFHPRDGAFRAPWMTADPPAHYPLALRRYDVAKLGRTRKWSERIVVYREAASGMLAELLGPDHRVRSQ